MMSYTLVGDVMCPYATLCDNVFVFGWNGDVHLGIVANGRNIDFGPLDKQTAYVKEGLSWQLASVAEKLDKLREDSRWREGAVP